MASDFFQRQSDARRSTLWLVCMFCLAVIAIVTIVVSVAAVVVSSQSRQPMQAISAHPEQLAIPALAGLITLVLIVGGSIYKILELRSGGGTQVAEGLGGRRLYPNTQDPTEKRLLNVVEEMAIASGTPVPPVFMLPEKGINAFAAGYSPGDAVLGVTRGCATQLSREQLQGVIAHEFSHILNGDMRMSIKLIGVLHGILLLGLTGHLILRMFFYSGGSRSRSNRSDGNNSGGQAILVIIVIGVVLLVLGFVGTFFGNLIKAAVSRQREYLADASAVQFTRNPEGIAGALKQIGARAAGSRLKTAGAAEASHMYFAQGVWEGFSGLWATHPPLAKRIRAIDPQWDGKFPEADALPASLGSDVLAGFTGGVQLQSVPPAASTEVPVQIIDEAVNHVGEPTTAHQHYAADLVRQIPELIVEATHEPYAARAVIFALLLNRQAEVRLRQLEILRKNAPADVNQLVVGMHADIDRLDARVRLPLVEMSLPALRAMSPSQYVEFYRCFVDLAKADQHIDLFEWMLSQVLLRHLRPQFERIKSPPVMYYGLQQLGRECSILLSAMAAAGNNDAVAKLAFQQGATRLSELKLQQRPRSESGLGDLRVALEKLAHVAVKHRGRIVDACAAAISADQHVTWQEAELLRGISDLLDCPMPPLLIPSAAASSRY
jgi:Zn-dependent protease with chaperone function